MSAAAVSWSDANQRHLMAAVRSVGRLLERHGAAADAGDEDVDRAIDAELAAAAASVPEASALELLCAAFHLSTFERDLILLCAGLELDGSMAGRCALAHGESRKTYPTFGLALAAFGNAHWSALSASAPLRRWRLIEVGTGDSLVSSPLRIDERVLHFLTGVDVLDERLSALVEYWPAAGALPASHGLVANAIAKLWREADLSQELPLVQLTGPDDSGRRHVAAQCCETLGLQLYRMRNSDLPASAAERERLARLWEREALLRHGALLIDADATEAPDIVRTLAPFLGVVHGPVFVSRAEPLRPDRRKIVRFDVRKPSASERGTLWRSMLGEAAPRLNGELDVVVSQFDLALQGIHAAAAELSASAGDKSAIGPALWEACRAQARPSMDDLAQRLEPAATWDDLVLPEAERSVLREIAMHVRQRFKVYESWGFARRNSRGLGISALFAGASGTGKTLAAEVLAAELRLDLYRIDLSSIVSKYIGETEKNLRRVFDAAEEGGAILLFDEADALFGKRSEVKDSHDRYANIEVSYLLQRMEAYRGLAILTSNLKDALDTAFLRRLRFVVQFPFPDATQRAAIWRRMFPPGTPVEGLDVTALARLNVAGGNIRNIALNAAFRAAEADEPVRMAHLLDAARSEYAKLERPLSANESQGW
jgi:hypothetical protein